jgi:hypothetical protein
LVSREWAAKRQNRGVDPIVLALILLVVVPIAVVWALAKSASLRGPLPRTTPRKPVEALVTEAIPEEHPDDEDEDDAPGPGPGRQT